MKSARIVLSSLADDVLYDLLNLRRIRHGPDNVFADFRHSFMVDLIRYLIP